MSALELARQSLDARAELGAYGIVTQALMRTGDLTAAMEYAQHGLEQALLQKNARSVQAFQNDLQAISARMLR